MDIHTRNELAEIRRLNDEFRATFRGGQIVLTQSVADLPEMVKAAALFKVGQFTDFNEKNDPHQEHDFLNFELCNRNFIFKIDYYDLSMEFGSEDPADPNVTKRIGTLMLSHDY